MQVGAAVVSGAISFPVDPSVWLGSRLQWQQGRLLRVVAQRRLARQADAVSKEGGATALAAENPHGLAQHFTNNGGEIICN
jgi:hypothetical protein